MPKIYREKIKYIMSWGLWPVLFVGAIGLTIYGFQSTFPVLAFNIIYISLAVILLVFERVMPHEVSWQASDGQTFANIAHTLMSKGVVQGLIVFGGVIGITSMVTPVEEPGYSIWPRDWPMIVQVALGLVAAELGLYWAHRIAHEVPFIWKFHAIHHSVTKLWVVNTGRFHFVDSLFSIVLGISILLVLGAPLDVVTWLSVVTAYIGLLTHCNIEMRFGPISWVFNTPGLHRWHHSKKLKEGNKNYGENLMLWDQVFGTFYNADYRPPADIGISEEMPPRFIDQLIWPFKALRNSK